jgi:hypothetical protein
VGQGKVMLFIGKELWVVGGNGGFEGFHAPSLA